MKGYLRQLVSLSTADLRARAVPLQVQAAACVLAAAGAVIVGSPEALEGFRTVATIVILLVPIILTHGIVSSDLRSGRALLWLQKPVSGVGYYLRRWAERTLLSFVLLILIAAFTSLVLVSLAPAMSRPLLERLPMILLIALVLSSLVYALSGWGLRPDSLFAVVLLGLFLMAQVLPDRLGLLAHPLQVIGIPFDDLERISMVMSGNAPLGANLDALGRVARALAFWIGVGICGTWVTTRSPLPREGTG